MAKARPGGADYLYALLTKVITGAPRIEVAQGMYYNTAFPGIRSPCRRRLSATASSATPTAPSRRSTIMRVTSLPI